MCPVRIVPLVALAFALLAGAGAGPDPAAEELVFLAQHIGADYGSAVHGGHVADASAYAEVRALAASLLERLDAPDAAKLGSSIRDLAPESAVRSLCERLAARLVDDLKPSPWPAKPPDVRRGRELYLRDCAACHGASGDGNGRVAAGMRPAPTSFRETRMSRVSPYEVFTATSFGVPGTDMPSHREGRAREDLWDVAFYVMTLRADFDPVPPARTASPPSLRDLAWYSNDALLSRIRASRPDATSSEVDAYRAPAQRAAADPALAGAEELERAFERAADRVIPSVVGIATY